MKYKVMGEEVLEAESLRQLAETMWQTKRFPEPSLEAWMEAQARRLREWNGKTARTDSPELFIQDLIAAGVIVPLEGMPQE